MADDHDGARHFVCRVCGNTVYLVAGVAIESWPDDVCGACWCDEQAGDEPQENCPHVHEDGSSAWVYTGTQYGGDDDRWHGEGRCYCDICGADGDA